MTSEKADRIDTKPVLVPNPSFDPENHATSESDVKPFEVVNPAWSIIGVCRVDNDGETTYDFERNGVQYREITDAEYLNPPNLQSTARLKHRAARTYLPDSVIYQICN